MEFARCLLIVALALGTLAQASKVHQQATPAATHFRALHKHEKSALHKMSQHSPPVLHKKSEDAHKAEDKVAKVAHDAKHKVLTHKKTLQKKHKELMSRLHKHLSTKKKKKKKVSLLSISEPKIHAALVSAYSGLEGSMVSLAFQPTGPSKLSQVHSKELSDAHKKEKSAADTNIDTQITADNTQMPVSSTLADDELNDFTSRLSKGCHKQFVNMLHGKGKARKIHLFGTSEKMSTSSATCSKLGGAICKNHARVTQMQTAPDGREMMARSDMEGDSCLPAKCVKERDLAVLAGFIQSKAVDALGPATHEQEPVEVMLDVDCTASGGASYSATGQWDPEDAGAGEPVRSLGVRGVPAAAAAAAVAVALLLA